MANERITEDLVRNHFKNDPLFKSVKFEEQKSYNKRVIDLLQTASKSGKGVGKPEFIVSFPAGNIDYLLVVECKASAADHRSKKLDNPPTFAVDGVLHYAKALSAEFDVVAIAVSGETQQQLKVYDNCTGTGGFLISAMKYMVEDAKGDGAKIKEIKWAA